MTMPHRTFPRTLATACTVLGLLGFAGCGSPPPIHYYTLVAPATTASALSGPPLAIELMPVGVPAQVDMEAIVVRQGDDALLVLENERWIAPIADELRAALAAELTRRLGATDVTGLARPAGTAVLRIKVDVRRMESVPASHALLEAAWSLRQADGGDERVLLCTTQVREPIEAGVPGVVRGQQRALSTLAGKIAQAAGARASGGTPACP